MPDILKCDCKVFIKQSYFYVCDNNACFKTREELN